MLFKSITQMKGLKKIRQIQISFLKKLLNVILKKESGFLGVKPIPPLRLLFARGESYRGANPECNRLKSLQQRLAGGGRGGKLYVIINLDQKPCWDSGPIAVSLHPVFFYHGRTSSQTPPLFFAIVPQI